MGARLRGSLPGLVALAASIGLVAAFGTLDDPPDFRTPQHAVAVAPAPAQAQESRVAGTLRWADAVTASLGRVRAGCLEEQGHPQAQRALEWRRPAAGTVRRTPLTVPLQDLGPASPAEARRFGLGGMSLAFDEGAAGVLVGHDPRFDRAAEQCDRWIYTEVAPGLRDLQDRVARFRDAAEGAVVSDLVDGLTPVLLERARCVQRDYPRFDPQRILDAEMPELVASAGVEAGRLVDRSPELSAADAPHGQVVVTGPVPADVYRPTRAEQRLALRWVACGEQVRLAERLADLQDRARSRVEAREGARAERLGAALEARWDALREAGSH